MSTLWLARLCVFVKIPHRDQACEGPGFISYRAVYNIIKRITSHAKSNIFYFYFLFSRDLGITKYFIDLDKDSQHLKGL